jgi:hypothetical protein
VFVWLTVNYNSFWVLQLTRVFTFRIRDSLRVFSRRQASRNKRVGAVGVNDGVGRSQQEQQQQQTFDGQTPPPPRKIGVQQANKLGKKAVKRRQLSPVREEWSCQRYKQGCKEGRPHKRKPFSQEQNKVTQVVDNREANKSRRHVRSVRVKAEESWQRRSSSAKD